MRSFRGGSRPAQPGCVACTRERRTSHALPGSASTAVGCRTSASPLRGEGETGESNLASVIATVASRRVSAACGRLVPVGVAGSGPDTTGWIIGWCESLVRRVVSYQVAKGLTHRRHLVSWPAKAGYPRLPCWEQQSRGWVDPFAPWYHTAERQHRSQSPKSTARRGAHGQKYPRLGNPGVGLLFHGPGQQAVAIGPAACRGVIGSTPDRWIEPG